MYPTEALAALGGSGRTRQLLAQGCTPYAIRLAVTDGTVVRVSRGAYMLPDAPPERQQAIKLGAAITCVSALASLGLPVPRTPHAAHLAVPRNFNLGARTRAPVQLHYQNERPLPGSVVSVAAALDCAGACLDEEWHLAAVDAALHGGLITLGDVMKFTRTSKERRDFLLCYADARAQAPGETIVRLRLVKAGFLVTPQAYIEGAGHVDMEVEHLLIVQVDGYGPHRDKGSFVRDRQGARAAIRAGRPQLSYAASEVLNHYSADVVGEVRDALREWRTRDPARIRPSGRQILRITRD